jgi:hypothetical protein
MTKSKPTLTAEQIGDIRNLLLKWSADGVSKDEANALCDLALVGLSTRAPPPPDIDALVKRLLNIGPAETASALRKTAAAALLSLAAQAKAEVASALSWGGFNLYGDRASIDEAKKALHALGTDPQLRQICADWKARAEKAEAQAKAARR